MPWAGRPSFCDCRKSARQDGSDGVTDFVPTSRHPPGTYTDDTQMSIAVAEALIEAGQRSLDELMPVMVRRFVEWASSPENDRARQRVHGGVPEPGSRYGLADRRRGWLQGLRQRYADGPDRPVLPPRPGERRRGRVRIEPYDPSPSDGRGGRGGYRRLRCAAGQRRYAERPASAFLELTGGLDGDYAAKLRQVPTVLELPPAEAMRILGDAWVGDEAVADALYCFLRTRTTIVERS